MALHLKRLGTSVGYRRHTGEFLCDGMKLLEDAVNSGTTITVALTAAPIPFPLPADTRVCHADRGLINSLSPLKNAQDILFACKMRGQGSASIGQGAKGAPMPREIFFNGGTHILLDNVQDPGNVGAIIRTANAFNIKSVIFYGACADEHNPKTIRASMGAVFRQHTCKMDLEELAAIKDGGVRFIGAALGEGCRPVNDVDFRDAVIAIGSEGYGLRMEIRSLCDEMATIPIAPGSESLNAAVAASIIMWEAQR